MSIYDPAPSPWPSRALAVLRIVAGLVFMTAGTMKLFGYPPPPQGAMGPLVLMSEVGIAGILEAFGGLAFILGLFTRPIAFILAGEMAVAYFQFHFDFQKAFWPTTNNGVPAVLYCFVFLYFVFSGAGAWSIDERLARSRAGRAA
ncbi:MAG: hypothetical protein JWM27_4170 [Gemmatimonadetes bacterium]|nr:hypothetical protein [Gemmatimonadota bacterium]